MSRQPSLCDRANAIADQVEEFLESAGIDPEDVERNALDPDMWAELADDFEAWDSHLTGEREDNDSAILPYAMEFAMGIAVLSQRWETAKAA